MLGSRVQARLNGRMTAGPTLPIEIEIFDLGQVPDRPQPGLVAVAGDRSIAQSGDLTLDRDFARSIQPSAEVAPARHGLVAVDHGQEPSLRPRAPGRARVRARLRE